ncbi:glycosyl transferase [Streptomyces armeniacus]|uniref:Glycosyl transferase n=1 Tax=Streptomyces armeniacus TaxID=83291 RepID=A0A345XVK2_9ACTN|nr:glycosyltransferase family 39 protein [Streptomyces armeniacus]AXK35668.1 glycosyl transferase [Streptomyces armeniacus]
MTAPTSAPAPAPAYAARLRTYARGRGRTRACALARRPGEPRWARPGLLALLLGTALLYAWHLSASGYANSFYSAAVQAGSVSWKAFFFGSLDAGNAITVDKPPAALWPMALSVRLFGLGSWQILLPQVLMGVAAVGALHASVRRHFGPAAGLLAGGVLALTPVAALMFRFNNPDALLALLMTVTVSCVLRALEDARTKWLLWAGAAVGAAFLTKTLQAFLILPPLALLYAVCAPTPARRRLVQLAAAGLAVVVAGGWWVAAVELWPASSRPYVGGSQHNSFLELTFGYNGLGRLNGEETGSAGGGGGRGGPPGAGGGGGAWGESGLGRMFNETVGGQISWLLPAALILLAAGLVATRRAPRTDARRAAFLAWGGALLMTAGVFSFMAGIFHEYYTVALAPYIAALVGAGTAVLWDARRTGRAAALTLAGTVAATAAWSYVLLARSPDWLPWLRWAVLGGGLVAAAVLALALALPFAVRLRRLAGPVAVAAACLGLAAALAGPAAYTLNTVATGHRGSIVTAGPSGGGPMGGPGRPDGPARDGGRQGQAPPTPNDGPAAGAPPGGGPAAGGPLAGGRGGGPGGGPRGGGTGGLLDGQTVSDRTADTLSRNAADHTWIAAAVGAQNAASYQLATGHPVMALGGFNGSDPSPTLAEFKEYVADGRIHYFVAPESRGGPGSGGPAGEIASWVESTFKKTKVSDTTLYDLTRRSSLSGV